MSSIGQPDLYTGLAINTAHYIMPTPYIGAAGKRHTTFENLEALKYFWKIGFLRHVQNELDITSKKNLLN